MLINSNFTKLCIAYFASIIGDWALKLVVPLYIYKISGSAILMSLAYAITFLPYVVIMPISGVYVDMVNQHKLLYKTDFLAIFLSILMFMCFFIPKSWSLYIIMPLLFIISSITSTQHPASQAFIPEIVESQNFAKANSYIISIMYLGNTISPLLGGILISVLGMHTTLIFNIIGFTISGILVYTIKYNYNPKDIANFKLKNIFLNLKEGFKLTFYNPIIKWATLLLTLVNLSTQLISSNLMFLFMNYLKLNSNKIGIIFAIQGMASVFGSLITPKIINYFSKTRFILFCIFLDAIALGFHMYATNVVILAMVRALSAFSEGMIVVAMFTLRYEVVQKEALGKVIGISRPISYMVIPIASIIGGYIIANSLYNLIILSTIIMLITFIIGLFTVFNSNKNNLDKYRLPTKGVKL